MSADRVLSDWDQWELPDGKVPIHSAFKEAQSELQEKPEPASLRRQRTTEFRTHLLEAIPKDPLPAIEKAETS